MINLENVTITRPWYLIPIKDLEGMHKVQPNKFKLLSLKLRHWQVGIWF